MLARDYIYILFEVLEEKGHSPIKICHDLALDINASEQLSVEQVHRLIRYVEDCLGIYHSGYLIGLQAGTSHHGMMGYAVKTSQNIKEAIQVDEQFLITRVSGIDFALRIDGDRAVINIALEETWLREEQFVFELIAGSLYSAYLEILPQKASTINISSVYSRPSDWDGFDRLTDMVWHFDQSKFSVSLPSDKLDSKLITADPALKSLLVTQLKQKLDELNTNRPLNEQVASIIRQNLENVPSIQDVATNLGLHERTLKRRLQKLGTSYQEILINLRINRSIELLKKSDYKIDEIAHAVGYLSPTTYKRLFKKWTGMTPNSIRKQYVKSIQEL